MTTLVTNAMHADRFTRPFGAGRWIGAIDRVLPGQRRVELGLGRKEAAAPDFRVLTACRGGLCLAGFSVAELMRMMTGAEAQYGWPRHAG